MNEPRATKQSTKSIAWTSASEAERCAWNTDSDPLQSDLTLHQFRRALKMSLFG